MSQLRRSISSLLRGKKPADTSMSGALPPVPELSALNITLNEDYEFVDEQALQRAFVESLHERTRTLEWERDAEKVARETVEESLRAKTAEVDGLLLKVRAGQAEENRERIRRLEGSIQDIGEEKKRLERDVEERVLQVAELEAYLKEYQIWSVKAAEEHAARDAAITTLEAEKEDLARLLGASEPVVTLQKEKSQVEERVKVLQAESVLFRTEREERAGELEKVRLQNRELEGLVAALNQEVENAGAQMREIEASRVLDASLTPRIMLVSKLLLEHARKGVQGSDDAFLQSCSPKLLTNQNLDIQLNIKQAKVLMEDLAVGELILIACDVCLLPRLATKPGVARPRLRVDEFIGSSWSRRTSCCSKCVCRQCFLQSLDESLSTDWWTNLGVANWLRCPVSSCEASLNISHIAGLETVLRRLGGKDTARHLEMYERAEAFRAALSRHSPDFSSEALLVASALQNHLVAIGRMHPLFDPMSTNRIPNETGRVPFFNPGRIRAVSVDHNGDNSIDVPLFISFLRRQETPKSCIVCTDDFPDIHTGSAEEWLELCEGLHGTWMWDMLLFPIKLELECRHTIDFCTACLQSHLKAQLEQHGRGASGRLSCPSADCGRKLSYQEIQLYGDRDSFTQYDKYLQLNALNHLPNFRWCLRPGCSSGQLYDDDDGPMDPHMYCDECGFEMCFVHSMPWHAGQTCAQYDSVRAHGDPEFQQTQDWIKNNTKPCPGCKENIQKGEYCFHMTCTRCRYEFCWECLADWKLIAPENTTYNVEAHKRGCPFRTNEVTPTQVSGTNLQEALRRRRRNGG